MMDTTPPTAPSRIIVDPDPGEVVREAVFNKLFQQGPDTFAVLILNTQDAIEALLEEQDSYYITAKAVDCEYFSSSVVQCRDGLTSSFSHLRHSWIVLFPVTSLQS